MKFVDFFDRVYVLNLPERKDRFRHMQRELARVGMPFDDTKVLHFSAIKPDTKAPFHKLGSKGCFLSVLEMLKTARTDHLNNVLIFQDDAQFLPEFQTYETRIVDQLKQTDWDIAQFGYYPLKPDTVATEILNPAPTAVGSMVPSSSEFIGAHCFAINGKSLDAFISFMEGLLSRPMGHPDGGPMPIDGAFNVFSRRDNATRLVLVPSLVSQISSRSDVTPHQYDQNPILRPVIGFARRLGLTKLVRRQT